ncbi:hypothetical protein TrLO_g9320 [Triparma laevis f. longispina]|uniref:WW domain-containing protein n=1 Tax=Triparma laevis f. longispina TaxID=1714387 RepID=A0A9W7DSD6_9STRA|nr:hypothetical protein TrLO_g9320 [Triparma laevis f. longispina]
MEKERLKDEEITPLMFLWEPYKPEFWYWEVVETARRLMMTGKKGSENDEEVWVEHLCEEGEHAGKTYYHHSSSGETVWERPKGEIRPASLQVNEKWKESEDGNGDTYWYDEVSGKTTWSDKSEG